MKHKRTVIIAAVATFVIAISFFILYCSYNNKKPVIYKKTGFYFDTVINISLYECGSEEILEECFSLCEKYENIFSPTKKESELYKLNEASRKWEYKMPFKSEISEELYNCMMLGKKFYDITDGRYNIAIRPVSELWNFRDNESGEIPSEENIKEKLYYVASTEYYTLNTEDEGYFLTIYRSGMMFDLGSVVKGFVADRIKDFLTSEGIDSAVVDLGGNIMCIGDKPVGNNKRKSFKIGIQMPFENNRTYSETVEIIDKSVVTSGIYQRYFNGNDGKLYHHILDAITGMPVESELASVTVVSDSSSIADALSTVCYIIGEEKSAELLEKYDVKEIIFIYKNGKCSKLLSNKH